METVDNDLVLIIWRDACFVEYLTDGEAPPRGVLKGTIGLVIAEDKNWIHLEQDINFENQGKRLHVYTIPKANIVEIVRTQFRARLRFWRKKGMEE